MKNFDRKQAISEAITFGLFCLAIGTLVYLEWIIKAGQ